MEEKIRLIKELSDQRFRMLAAQQHVDVLTAKLMFFVNASKATMEYCNFLDSIKSDALWKKRNHSKLDRLYKRMRQFNTIPFIARKPKVKGRKNV